MFKPGMLIEVGKSHMAITKAVQIVGLEAGEFLWIVETENHWQGVGLRINTGELVHLTAIDPTTETPTYREALR